MIGPMMGRNADFGLKFIRGAIAFQIDRSVTRELQCKILIRAMCTAVQQSVQQAMRPVVQKMTTVYSEFAQSNFQLSLLRV